MNIVQKLSDQGQSIWLDNISRNLLSTGKLKEFINQGVAGLTSNPSIFEQSISRGHDYDKDIKSMSSAKSAFEIYDCLTMADIKEAADMFLEVYEMTNGADGYVSLEINPMLANKTSESIAEARRLYTSINRPNLMIKVPATEDGYPVISALIASGINVNATLIFSPEQYISTAKAFICGLKEYFKKGGDVRNVASVASVFVSRVDTVVDKLIDEKLEKEKNPELAKLKGKAAVANCKIVYQNFLKIFKQHDWKQLMYQGARVQRVLWASTSSKNPDYSDVKYIEELICPDSVNTVPDKTLIGFLDHGKIKKSFLEDLDEAENIMDQLKKFGIDINKIQEDLLDQGLKAFVQAFEGLLSSIDHKVISSCNK